MKIDVVRMDQFSKKDKILKEEEQQEKINFRELFYRF